MAAHDLLLVGLIVAKSLFEAAIHGLLLIGLVVTYEHKVLVPFMAPTHLDGPLLLHMLSSQTLYIQMKTTKSENLFQSSIMYTCMAFILESCS